MSNDRAGTPAELAAKHWWKRFIQSLPDTGTVDTLSPSFPPLSTVQSGDRRCSSLCSLLGPGAKPGLCAEGCIPGRTSDATRAVKAQGLGFKWGTSNTLHLFYTLTKDKNEEENLYTAGCIIIQYLKCTTTWFSLLLALRYVNNDGWNLEVCLLVILGFSEKPARNTRYSTRS